MGRGNKPRNTPDEKGKKARVRSIIAVDQKRGKGVLLAGERKNKSFYTGKETI